MDREKLHGGLSTSLLVKEKLRIRCSPHTLYQYDVSLLSYLDLGYL